MEVLRGELFRGGGVLVVVGWGSACVENNGVAKCKVCGKRRLLLWLVDIISENQEREQ